jgi:hypothetical protein
MSVAIAILPDIFAHRAAANTLAGIPRKITASVKRMDFAVQSKFTLAAVYAKVSRRISGSWGYSEEALIGDRPVDDPVSDFEMLDGP